MFFDYKNYDEKEKDFDLDKLLLTPRPIQDQKNEILDTALPSAIYETKKEKFHRKVSIAEDSNTYLLEDTIEASDDIRIDDLERHTDNNTHEEADELVLDATTDNYDISSATEEYERTEPEIANTEIHESQLLEKIRLLQGSFDKPYISKYDNNYKQITELRKIYDDAFTDFEDFIDFLNVNTDLVNRELFIFYYNVFTLPNPEQYCKQFRTEMFSTSPYADGRGYMIDQLKTKMRSYRKA